jgi:hypothetical protein
MDSLAKDIASAAHRCRVPVSLEIHTAPGGKPMLDRSHTSFLRVQVVFGSDSASNNTQWHKTCRESEDVVIRTATSLPSDGKEFGYLTSAIDTALEHDGCSLLVCAPDVREGVPPPLMSALPLLSHLASKVRTSSVTLTPIVRDQTVHSRVGAVAVDGERVSVVLPGSEFTRARSPHFSVLLSFQRLWFGVRFAHVNTMDCVQDALERGSTSDRHIPLANSVEMDAKLTQELHSVVHESLPEAVKSLENSLTSTPKGEQTDSKHKRSKSPRGRAKSRSKSPRGRSKSRSKSPRGRSKSRSKSPRGRAKSRSKSPRGRAKSRSKSPRGRAKSRSKSPHRTTIVNVKVTKDGLTARLQ